MIYAVNYLSQSNGHSSNYYYGSDEYSQGEVYSGSTLDTSLENASTTGTHINTTASKTGLLDASMIAVSIITLISLIVIVVIISRVRKRRIHKKQAASIKTKTKSPRTKKP